MQKRKSHPDSFKKDAVRRLIARGSKTVTEIAKELGVSPSMLHRWRERFEPELTGAARSEARANARRSSGYAASCAI